MKSIIAGTSMTPWEFSQKKQIDRIWKCPPNYEITENTNFMPRKRPEFPSIFTASIRIKRSVCTWVPVTTCIAHPNIKSDISQCIPWLERKFHFLIDLLKLFQIFLSELPLMGWNYRVHGLHQTWSSPQTTPIVRASKILAFYHFASDSPVTHWYDAFPRYSHHLLQYDGFQHRSRILWLVEPKDKARAFLVSV